MTPRSRIGAAVGAAASLVVAAQAPAETFKDKGGVTVFVPTSVESTKQADGTTVLKVSSTGIGITDLPFPFDYMKSQCTGTTFQASDSG